jgi:hypothetical protein
MYPSPATLETAVRRIVEALPELRHSYAAHQAEYDEVLPYMFLPDVVRDMIEKWQVGDLSPNFLDRLSKVVEELLAERDQGIHDLVGLGLLEELKYSVIWPEVEPHLGPLAKAVAAEDD